MARGNTHHLHLLTDSKEITSILIDLLVDLGYAAILHDNTFEFISTACRKPYSRNRSYKTGLNFQKATQKRIATYFNAIIKGEPIKKVSVSRSTLDSLCLRSIGVSITKLRTHDAYKNKNLDFSIRKIARGNPVIPNKFTAPIEALEYFITHEHIKLHEPVVISGILMSDELLKNWEAFIKIVTTKNVQALLIIQDSSSIYLNEIVRRVNTDIRTIRRIEAKIIKLTDMFLNAEKESNSLVILCPIDDLIADLYQGVFCATTWSAVTISLQPLSEEVSWMLELRKKEMLEKHIQKRVQQYFSLLTEK